ncbi:DNA-directed RNA polymerase III subunit RPC3-like isoform X1 [Zingiber officinale]|uniref:DNA-directed RNA polymerase III subunit RPC3-like isoform X1 n=1 Tax=Zingiber officinale TaxID=94328 RepID=UPI001C4B5CDE|nr:DNA-directed RNA polymerase III subunit RPC3-like isoform X1 [Zingiber officinale]
MISQDGVNLAVCVITAHFGDLVAKVCSCLLKRGSLSLQEIVRTTEFSNSQVKNCLLVLIQHNCVQAFSVPRGGAGGATKTVTQYMALFDNILHRMRFSKFLAIVKGDLGVQCETLLQGLLGYGRLTFDQLIVRATSKQSEGSSCNVDVLRKNFSKLVHGHYVERCPRPEPFIAPSEEAAPARKRSSKFREEILSLEQQVVIAASLTDAERFSEIPNAGTDASVTEDKQDVTVGDKRKFESTELDEETEATISETEVLWRANFQKFVFCLKKKVCVAKVRSRKGLDAGVVLEAIIESSEQECNSSKIYVKASMDSILEKVRGKPDGISMTLELVRGILEDLDCSSHTEDCNVYYTIELQCITESCRKDEVESLILTKYGKEAFRIFGLLNRKGSPVETDQISDFTLVDKKVAQQVLYNLWKDDFLSMQKVSVEGTGQRRENFLWKLNKKSSWNLVLNHLYHAALNLNQKITHVAEQEHEALLSEEKLKHLKNSRMILQLSLLKLDDAIMIFHDF